MVAFSGCGKADSAECPDLRTQEFSDGSGVGLYIRARDDISIHNIIINRGNCLYTCNGFNGFYFDRNGVDRIQIGSEPLTSDSIEQSIKHEETKEVAYKELNAGPKKLAENIDLKFGEERSIWLSCKPLEVVFETNLGQCEYKFD
ncbi:MAG: hypothetical protein MR469_01390 [Campylobacter sp.]|uniref:hypothetical protein n=1 Tax=Campylobacter sp. TaxID=205 RepID=UPI002AA74787|nr:hypothetical protein [Campylobacter sp.]MCI6694284.1 hypothetical protein [Campylobacter sp.]MCI6819482.1 hypothetical protein [Campylobacter sp.]